MGISVRVHSLALFGISGSASSSRVGVLLGQNDRDSVQVVTSFELQVSNNSDGLTVIDQEFYNTRLHQFKTVLPHLEKVGIYHVVDANVNSSPIIQQSLCQQLHADLLLVVNNANSNNKEFVKSYYKSELVNSNIVSDEIETISINTISKHQHYSQDRKLDLNLIDLSDYKQTISTSVDQLHHRVESIIAYCNSNRSQRADLSSTIEVNNLIGQLVKKINYLKTNHEKIQDPNEVNEKLLSNELSLITTQLLALEKLRSQIDQNAIKILRNSSSLV